MIKLIMIAMIYMLLASYIGEIAKCKHHKRAQSKQQDLQQTKIEKLTYKTDIYGKALMICSRKIVHLKKGCHV